MILALFPTYAAAEWSPRPAMFSYDATFNTCTADPTAPDLAQTCADALAAAYALKRSVARAFFACHPQSLSTCAAPFEDEGLPAIAARIAVDAGCDAMDVTRLDQWATFSPDHCITVISDIMIDEGVVPIDTNIACRTERSECGALAGLNLTFWVQAVIMAAKGDALIADIQARNFTDCNMRAQDTTPQRRAFDVQSMGCAANRSAALWADLTQQNIQDN